MATDSLPTFVAPPVEPIEGEPGYLGHGLPSVQIPCTHPPDLVHRKLSGHRFCRCGAWLTHGAHAWTEPVPEPRPLTPTPLGVADRLAALERRLVELGEYASQLGRHHEELHERMGVDDDGPSLQEQVTALDRTSIAYADGARVTACEMRISETERRIAAQSAVLGTIEGDLRVLTEAVNEQAGVVALAQRLDRVDIRLTTRLAEVEARVAQLERPEPVGPVAPFPGVHVEAGKERAAIVGEILAMAPVILGPHVAEQIAEHVRRSKYRVPR